MKALMYRALLILLAAAFPALEAAAEAPATLFRDVTVVVLPQGERAVHRDVLVRAGRIASVSAGGSLEPPAGARVIDGGGRYLMPGLAEAHAHVPGPAQKEYARDVLLLYLAHGLTSIRGMLGDPWHLELREALERGELPGPRLYTSGPSINGRSAPTPERARTMAREQAAAGYDFLKLHPGLTLDTFDALATTAGASNITLQGHVSDAVGLARALEARQRAIDHLDGYVQALSDAECLAAAGNGGFFGIGYVQCVDEARIPALARRTRAAGTWIVPTQILLEQWAAPPTEAALRARPATRFLPSRVLAQWLESRRSLLATQDLSADRARRFVALRRTLIRELHREGVPILLGSDAPQVFNVPGDSALEELALYVEIGLTPAQALATGTVNVARFFGAQDRLGQVREGYEADLVLLEADPLVDVAAVRRLAGVMVSGRWFAKEELDGRLAALVRSE